MRRRLQAVAILIFSLVSVAAHAVEPAPSLVDCLKDVAQSGMDRAARDAATSLAAKVDPAEEALAYARALRGRSGGTVVGAAQKLAVTGEFANTLTHMREALAAARVRAKSWPPEKLEALYAGIRKGLIGFPDLRAATYGWPPATELPAAFEYLAKQVDELERALAGRGELTLAEFDGLFRRYATLMDLDTGLRGLTEHPGLIEQEDLFYVGAIKDSIQDLWATRGNNGAKPLFGNGEFLSRRNSKRLWIRVGSCWCRRTGLSA